MYGVFTAIILFILLHCIIFFQNFVKNSFKYLGVDDTTILEVWNIIEKFGEQKSSQKRSYDDGQEDTKRMKLDVGKINNEKVSEKLNKHKQLNKEKFNWLEAIINLLNKCENKEIKFKKIRKKVK